MQKSEKILLERLAHYLTTKQGKNAKYVYIAHALWMLIDNDKQRAELDIAELEKL